MHNILTVLTGTRYSVKDVNTLYNKLKNNTTKDFLFTCYTDHIDNFNSNIIIKPITKKDKKLQWYKIDFFKSNFVDGDNLILMDIDMDILGNIDFLFNEIAEDEFKGTHRWWWQEKDLDAGLKALSGSVYSFKNGKHSYISEKFEEDIPYWQEYFIKNKTASGPVNGEQHFVQMMVQNKNFTFFPSTHIAKWHTDSLFEQTRIEYSYVKYTGNKYLEDGSGNFHPDLKIVHYAGR